MNPDPDHHHGRCFFGRFSNALLLVRREILRLIAEGQTPKEIGDLLKVSPKTVEYHRMKLVKCLNVHDVPGLVRFALRVGLLPQES